ncbi:MAG: hypothetical protein ABIP85_09405 [Chthoniobacteraceae bacterium]
MTDLMRQIIESKRARRKELAALPVGEKLRILDQMNEATRVIAASRPPKPANPVRLPRR